MTETTSLTYTAYLTTPTEGSAHPTEIAMANGLSMGAALGICSALNEGGYLREGVEAHFVSEDE